MSENPNEGQTSADIKRQIEAASKESKQATDLKESRIPLTGMIAAEINASESTTEQVPQTASTPQPVTAAEKVTEPKASVDSKEWAKKKWSIDGDFQSADEVLEALRKRDSEFHKKRTEQKSQESSVGVPPTGYQPAYAPPAYQPPAYPQQYGYQQPPAYNQQPSPRAIVEELARQNNMLPEDFERVAKVSRAVYEAAAEQDRRVQEDRWNKISIDTQKNNVFRELATDPVFHRQDVRAEYSNVLEQMQSADPRSFENDPEAYRRAFDRSLQNIARKQLEGRPLQEGVPPVALPINPPRPLGQGSGGGALENENGFDRKAFDRMSVKDQAAVLDRMGLRTTY